MIDEIRVENLALITSAALMPDKGLTVITGETGAGKTALLSALKLLMGERGDRGLIREGADALRVSGRLFLGEDELVITRQVNADGRSRATINGEMVSLGELSQKVGHAIDLCSQHEHQSLMRPATHRELLDLWAGEELAPLQHAYKEAFGHAQAASAALAEIDHAAALSDASLEEARFTLSRIEAVSPSVGEYEALVSDTHRAEHAEVLAMGANGAYEALADEDGALDRISSALSTLENAAAYDGSLEKPLATLRDASYMLEDVSREMRAYRDKVEFDGEALAAAQERLAAFQGLMRAFGPTMEEVFARRDEAARLLGMVDDATERREKALAELDAAEAALDKAARELGKARRKIAPQFARQVSGQMDRLQMNGAELTCEVTDLPREQWSAHSPQSVEFCFRPGKGLSARPLAKIASGGEVSRVMLAIKVVLGTRDKVASLVFDEVDAGVGGATAQALGELIAELSLTHQVIVVTHLAQVAVYANRHFRVMREGNAKKASTTHIVELSDEERVGEIARMLSGSQTEASLAHARELLASAGFPSGKNGLS